SSESRKESIRYVVEEGLRMNRLRPASSSLRRATLSIFTSQRLAGQYENGRAFPEAQRRSRADRCLKDSIDVTWGRV
ncbi:MAG: hypothetical protein WA755_07640, partial [Candidatus Acidiferrales bacterium]